MTALYKNRERFRKFLNRNQWQVTWHLPKSPNGEVNWLSEETKSKVLETLKNDEAGLKVELSECFSLIRLLEGCEL